MDIPSELAPKLAALYKELPPTDKFPDPKKDIEDFKNMVVKLRPFVSFDISPYVSPWKNYMITRL